MKYHNVKFTLNFEDYDSSIIRDVFNKAKSILNWQFDENYNAYLIDDDINYEVNDISNLEKEDIEKITESFFDFTFDNVFDIPLYKLLALKNNEKLIVLANINSLIFDYDSINDFYELFDDLNKSSPKFDLDSYYGNVRDYLNSSDFKKDSNYWRDYILNTSDYIKFYNLRNNNFKSQKINADSNSVLTFIKNHDCSLFDFYASVFSLYLSRIDRLDGCLLKTIIPGEKNDFDKNALLKIDVNKNDSFEDLLNELNSAFEDIIEYTKVDVDNYLDENISYYSVYDFSHLNENAIIHNGNDCALTLNIHKDSLELIYNSSLFSDVYINHTVKNIESLIGNVLESPNQTLCNIDILSDEEKELISDFRKGKSVEVEENKLFSHSFRQHALENPDTLAIDDGVNRITYGELERSSNSIANDLYKNHNISPGSRVGLMLPRNYHYPELVLALNKIGAAHIPIDLMFPVNRIGHMLIIAQAEHIITTRDMAQKLDLNINIISIEDLNDNDDVDLELLSKKDDLFAIFFTSGTTGIPKGVMFYNSQFPWAGAAYTKMFNFNQGDVVGSYFSFSFVASLLIIASLYLGGSVRLFNEEEQKNSLLLLKVLKETHLNSLILPPTVGIPIFENEDLNLDYLVLAGAKLHKLSKKERHTKIVNFYGTTEVIFAISKIYDLRDIKNNRVPIGKPVANTWAYILDENSNPMPIGVPGEICISGGIVSGGYCNDPELMAEVFVDNPFSDRKLNRIMYRTGDIGFYNYDGEIEIIGREDNQLSVRGFRIESNEILTIMKSFNELSDIYLDVDNDNLIAYYTTNDELDINEVKSALENELPYYMIPSLFIELEEIPLNLNGKIDKAALRTMLTTEDIEIADEVIRCIVDAFKEVLNLEHVMIDDDFVSLGGNSLSAMKLQLILKEKLGVYLSSNEIIDLSTPNEIGNHIKYNLNVHSAIDEDKYTFDEPCPLSESQLNVYLDEIVNDMGTAYNNSFKIDFKDNYSVDEIKDAVMKLSEVFPILKCRILTDNEVPSLAFDAEPEISEGSLNDIDTFVREFELDRCLSRFMIVEDNNSIILCLDFHHLIFDGTSLNILLNGLDLILNGESVDFVDTGSLRQKSFEEIIESEYMDDAQEFFEIMLADRYEAADLLECVDGDDGEWELVDTFDIDDEHLNSFLQSRSITYNQFFTGVFGYTLSRFSGSDKVIFNMVEDGRGHIDLSQSVGMFVKTLPLLMDCKNQNIDSFLEYSSNLVNSVMKYDMYPFRVLAHEYDLNSNIVFQYSHDLFSNVINKKDLKYDIDELQHDSTADLSFYIFNTGKGKLTIRILYSSRYSKTFIRHFAESYRFILNEMLNVGELKDINYISDSDIELLDSFNQTDSPLDYDDILEAFNDNLSKYPDNKLVCYNDKSYTYAESAFIADKIAERLKEIGIEKNDNVSFLVNRCEAYLLSILGIVSMGAVYVPLDDEHPDDRIQFILKDTKSKVIIVSDETYERAKNLADELEILNISDIVKEDIGTLSSLPVISSSLVCILYTSGTTGIPKGVKITRKSLVNYIGYYVKKSGMSHNDVFALYASIGFDVGAIKSIFVPMYCGACLDILPKDVRMDMNKLNNHFNNRNVNHAHLPTQVAKLFLNENDNHSLDVLCTGGEKLGEIDYSCDYVFVDSYGPTEACVSVTAIEEKDKIDSSSIGYLLDNIKAYILDDEFRRVPVGAVGELYLSGIQLADGYLNRDEETAKAFLDNPFDGDEGYDVMYRTGDMVRILPDSSFGIVGRRDSQVKIRGNRVELSEIVSDIQEIEFIEDVTLQTVKHGSNNEIVAYVVVNNDLDDNEVGDLICEHVRERKPEYMVPSFVIVLDSIPLTVNGKVNKRALPEVDMSSLHAEYIPPSTRDEKRIVEAFENVFDQKRIGLNDDFIRLGGDSLTAIKLLSHLKEYNLTAADILNLRTPLAIAGSIEQFSFDVNKYSLESGCPLNEPQLNVYLDIRANEKYDSYLLPLNITIPERYSVESLVKALEKMFTVHPILNMKISDEHEVPYLVKGNKPPIFIESSVSEEFGHDFVTKAFDFNDSLCRFLILKNDGDYDLFAVFHHLIFDGLSVPVFEQDLFKALNDELLEIDDSFLKLSSFSAQVSETDEFELAEAFYDSMLADVDEAGTLLDSVGYNEPGTYSLDLDIDIDEFLEKHYLSKNVLFTGAFAYTLSRFVGTDKVYFNTVENGRDRFNNFDSIGMFVNTLPLFADCKNQDVSSFMDYMSDLIYGAMGYNYYPYRLLAKKYNLHSDIFFQFKPDWFVKDMASIENSLEKIVEDKIIEGMRDFISDFNVDVSQNGDKYSLNIIYSNKFTRTWIESFSQSYKMILHDMINVDELSEINYITSSDLKRLDSINQTEYPLDYDDILDAFNDTLSKNPDNTLVSFNDKSYTYAEGAFIADKIAKSLIDLGVEAQDNVAFLTERSEYYLFSILGIVAVGAAYVPLDDEHPDDRMQFILKDTKSKVIIVSDETYERAKNLADESVILNISDIVKEDIGTLTSLPVISSHLICILYTSGTTGIPKGVKITRKSVVNHIGYYMKKSGISSKDVFALYASIGFDIGAIKSVFAPIYCGACLDIVPKDVRLDMKKLNDHFHNQNVTHTHLPTQIAKLFINEADNHSLDVLYTGGEKLSEIDYPSNYMFIETYGPTEACVYVTEINASDRVDSSSIGHLRGNIKAYVLDDEFRRVPVGAVGELYLSGIQLADGYLNREEETANAFLDNPFDDGEEYDMMYRTGDMVRILPDGSIGIVGRRDSQVKIRGNRVELSEIVSEIQEIEFIEDVTLQTVKHTSTNELVAYVVVNNDLDDDTVSDLICEHVRERKPEYMVPSFVIRIDEIPLTVNGKVDKRALPEVDLNQLRSEYVAPTNKTERHIVDAFEVVFNQKGIGLNDDFVRLGGDSITAIRVISLLEKNDISCSARDILNYKTPYLIAQNVQTIESVSYDATEGIVDLLPIQEYYFDQINRDNYTQHFILKSTEKLDKDILQEAFNELCNVHDMLRAHYRTGENGEAIQEILPVNTEISHINEYDITDDFEESVKEIFIKSSNSLDIQNNMIEINLINYNNDSYIMIIINHLIIDGVSWDILLTDLTYIYTSLKAGKEIELLRPYPYKNWVEDVRNLVYGISAEEKQHWTKINELLDDSTIKGNVKTFSFNVDSNYNVNSLLMLSEDEYWALAIARAYKKTFAKDIIFNRETYGRDESIAKLNRTIGWFTSEYPILVNTNNGYDDISIMNDVYSIKAAFKEVNNLGLNYYSLIYTTKELEFKHCPITFNFLSSEFTFKNELLESYIPESAYDYEMNLNNQDLDDYGMTFNVVHNSNSYSIGGSYADNTYISEKFDTFIENIKYELEFIGDYKFKDDNIVCCLSESQLGIYLDERANEKGSAYSGLGIWDCDSDKTIDEIKEAIHAVIGKHPILKGRVLDGENVPLLICDSYPSIEIVQSDNYYTLAKAFDLNSSLSRFYIAENDGKKSIIHNLHHIISDATTHTIINNDLKQALSGELDGEIDLGFVYASRDSFESQYGNKYKSAKKFFHEAFADIDDVHHLIRDIDGKIGSVSLPIRGIRENVESFTKNNGITVSNLLNSVFAYTYSRFTGGDKVYYNFTEHGRHESYLENACGMFVRTIPIIVNCEDRPVNDYVADISDLILKSMTNSIYPFRLLAREFDLSNEALFEYNYSLNDFEMGDELVVRDEADTVCDFLCVANDLKDGFVITVSHLDKFSQDTAIKFVEAYKEILIQILEKENLADIDYVSTEDIKRLDAINRTEHPLAHGDILDAFNDNLSKYPKNNLVSYNDNIYSYGEGAFIAGEIASKLKAMGIEKNDNVAFLVERSELYMFSILGILSAGAVYVPLDDSHPDERIDFMIRDTDSKVIIVSDETLKRAKELSDGVELLNISDIINGDIKTLEKLDADYGDLACILYTSGTTGVPKGVKITRKSVINVAESYIETYGLNSTDVYGLFSAIGFDVSSFVITSVMCAGACLSVIPEEIRLNMTELNRYFIRQNVSHAFITTQVGKLFMQSVDETSLEVLLVAGEKLGEFESPKDYRLIDAYGPTEAFAFVSSIDNNDKPDGTSVGILNHNTKAYILDNQHRRVPCGAVGELYLSGYQVADGYLNRPEENAKAFIDNPFDDDENYNTLYGTGDLVKLLPDGSIGIVGRRDSQVKIRGNRVELSEIESTIREIDYVDDITVQTVKHDTNNEVVAYVVVSNDLDADELKDSICAHVHEHKPEYMVPSYVIILDEIPLNVNGKVDKRALPEVDRSSLHAEYVAPRNEKEKEIVEAFERALNMENISVYDDFIRLGGDSLTAIKVITYIKSDDITMADIFAFRTPEAIAKNMSDFSFDLDLYSLESGCPLNSAQINVFADVIIYNKRNAYHIPGYIPIPKRYGIENILESLDGVLNAHPILSMCLSGEYETNDNNISNLDLLSDLIRTGRKFGMGKIMDLISAYGLNDIGGLYNMMRTTIRLLKGEYPYLVKGSKPPISVESNTDTDRVIDFYTENLDIFTNLSKFMIVETEESYYLLYLIHHLIFDAVSAGVLKHDLQILLDGGSIDFDDTFLKTSAMTHQIKSTDKFDEASEYYYPILSDIDDVSPIIEDNTSGGYSSSSYDLNFDKEAFKSFLNKEGISENVLFTSVFAYTLSQFVNGDKVLFTMIENGRDRFNENFIGMTSNVMPIVVDCKNQSIDSYMEYMADTVYGALRHSYYPILLLYQRYNFEVSILFQYVPNWIADDFNNEDNIGEIDSQEIVNQILNTYSDYLTEFLVQVYQNGSDYRLFISNSNKYSDKMIEEFKNTFISTLSKIINADGSCDLSDILK